MNLQDLRMALAAMPSDHDAAGDHRPSVSEVFSPDQHANALDPNTPVVVGSRGTGKSFWAGVLEQDDTRAFAAALYPHLGLEKVRVAAGYTGFNTNGAVSARTIDSLVPEGKEAEAGYLFWMAVILRAARSAVKARTDLEKLATLISKYADSEDLEAELSRLDAVIASRGELLLITFDALDTWSTDWRRSSALTDSLFRVVWSLRSFRSLKAKVFIRPEQLNDESLTFVEMPKLRSGRVQLEWSITDLYGLLFWRLSELQRGALKAFRELLPAPHSKFDADRIRRRRSWKLLFDRFGQETIVALMAGPYMGKSHKKGKTYEWPYNHLADARGEVTPRSFLKLFSEAAKVVQPDSSLLIDPEAMRHGLREASKVRVDQLVVEYKWVKRALAPLAGLRVPCEERQVFERWSKSSTVKVIFDASRNEGGGFLPPFPKKDRQGDRNNALLAEAMARIGVFSYRSDGRVDMPDLFRVAARMLKKGGVAPEARF